MTTRTSNEFVDEMFSGQRPQISFEATKSTSNVFESILATSNDIKCKNAHLSSHVGVFYRFLCFKYTTISPSWVLLANLFCLNGLHVLELN